MRSGRSRLRSPRAAASRSARTESGWKVGKVFFHDKLAYQFDLQPEPGHKRPAFVNLQQYHLEEALLYRLAALGHRVRWKNKAVGIEPGRDAAAVEIDTPHGRYRIESTLRIAVHAPAVRCAT